MIQAQRTQSPAQLTPALIRRRRSFGTARPMPVRAIRLPVIHDEVPAKRTDWAEDLRFFVTCYLAGFAFFLIMLS